MTLPITNYIVNNCKVSRADNEAPLACALGSFDLLLTITSLVVGILGLTAVLNLPVAASGTFVAIGIAIPVIYAAKYFGTLCNK